MRRILKDRGSAVLATVLRANCNVKLHTGGRLLVQPGKQALGDVGSGLLVDDIEQEALSVLLMARLSTELITTTAHQCPGDEILHLRCSLMFCCLRSI